jgi:signal transduction histidine kinase/ligand-binding sensor domain-containing protein
MVMDMFAAAATRDRLLHRLRRGMQAGPVACLCALLLLPLGTCTYAQEPADVVWGHQAWSTEDGLPQNSVHQILQTRDGFLWIATEGGVARFDGAHFKLLNHANTSAFTTDDTCCLAEDARGALWIGTSDGLIRDWHGTLRRFSTQAGLPSASILSVTAGNDGAVFILTDAGLARVGPDGSVSPLPGGLSGEITAVASDKDGDLWLATRSAIDRYDPRQRKAVRTVNVPRAWEVTGLESTGDGALWWRTNSGVSRLLNGKLSSWKTGKTLPGTRVNSLMVDARGSAWIGTNRGLVSLESGTLKLKLFSDLGTSPILSTFEDREGNIWVGTENSGLAILRPEKFRQLPGLADRVITAIVQTNDGTAWVGTRDDGLWRCRDGAVDRAPGAAELASQIILSLAAGNHNDLWVGTPDGLNHLEGDSVHVYTSVDGLPDDFIRSLLVDPDGSLWIGTRRGLAHLQHGQVQTVGRADGLQSDLIGALLRTPHSAGKSATDSILWVATLGGISRLSSTGLTTYTQANGLPGSIITSFAEQFPGTLWIGSRDGGLSEHTRGVFAALHPQGVPRSIDSLLLDQLGFLWMGTRQGLVRASAAELESCASNSACDLHAHRFGAFDGMPSEEASTIGHPAAWRMQNGDLWFATRKGVAIVDPAHLHLNKVPPPVVMESFDVDGAAEPTNRQRLKLSPGHASFTFNYAGLSYSAPSRVRYRFKLEGFDRNWTDAGNRRTAYYTSLPARYYTFRVQAANDDGVWNRTGAALSFSITPPFYERIWFYLLLAVGIAAAIYYSHYRRVQRLQAQFQAVLGERSRIAREIHDTLAQDFVGVSLQLETAVQMLSTSDLAGATEQINQTRILVREGLQDARQSIWELRANTTEDRLPTRLTRLVERASRTGLVAETSITGAYRALDSKLESELLRIAQEALTNVIRHAAATSALLKLEYSTHTVTLSIVDDGTGFEPAEVRGEHYGLQGMRERAAAIRAQFDVHSSREQGTRIHIVVPTE